MNKIENNKKVSLRKYFRFHPVIMISTWKVKKKKTQWEK